MIIPVTGPEYLKGKDIFANTQDYDFVPVADDEPTLADFVRERGCHAVVVGVRPYTGALYTALPKGGLILRFGVGTDSISRIESARRRISVANTPGALDRSVAEHTIFLMGALLRHITCGDAEFRQGRWSPITGDELQNLRLAIVGMGRIGSDVARIAHAGFGMETLICEMTEEQVVAARLGLDAATMRQHFGYTRWSADPDAILPYADVVSAHLPVVPDTVGYFNAARFDTFKLGSLFVNTARGALVVEQDLLTALTTGRLGGAALDVYEHEPYTPSPAGADLRHLPNVVMTPHVASNTRAANRRMAQIVVANLRHWDAGMPEKAHIVF